MANPGKYDRKLGIERLVTGPVDGFNAPQERFELVFQAWAARSDLSDAERWAGGEEVGLRRARFVVRSTDNSRTITSDDRLVLSGSWDGQGVLLDGEVWQIIGTKEAQGLRNTEIEITAEIRSDPS